MKVFLLGIVFVSFSLFGQEFSFNTYAEENGISQPYIYGIDQQKDGVLCISTSEGAFQFDGKKFSKIGKIKDGNNAFFKSVLIAENQSICLGTNEGDYYEFLNDELLFKIKEKLNTTPVNAILELNNSILICHQNGEIVEVLPSRKTKRYKIGGGSLFSQFKIYNGKIIAGYESGFKIITLAKGKLKVDKSINVNDDAVESICTSKTYIYLGTSASGLYIYSKQKGLHKIKLGEGIDNANIKAIVKDNLSSIWISIYGVGVVEVKRNSETGIYYKRMELTPAIGLSSEFITSIFIDNESNMWFGSYGNGITKLKSNFLVDYDLSKLGLGNYVYSIVGQDKQYCAMENGIAIIDPANDTVYSWKYNSKLPKDRISTLAFHKPTNILFVGTKTNGVFTFVTGDNSVNKLTLSEDNLSKAIRHLNVVNDNLYISTLNGLYEYNIANKELNHYTAADGLPHNSISSTFLKSDGKLLIATVSSGIYYLLNGKIREEKMNESIGMLDIISYVEDRRGGLWVATNGQGLLHLNKDFLTRVTKDEGLFSNFVYQLSYDKKNTIWCGHNGGLSRVNMNERVVQLYSKKNKVNQDFLENSTNKDDNNNLWFGTNDGVKMFSFFHDKFDLVDLKPSFVSAIIDDEKVITTRDVYTNYTQNNVRIFFKAVSLSNPHDVIYQYKLSGWQDGKWSKPSKDNYADLLQISDGAHRLYVRVRIGNGEWSKVHYLSEIYVKKPTWKEWWFNMIFLIVAVTLISFVVKYRTKALKRQKDELEVKLAVRTKEIERQKNQIKFQYKETQDSINYGVRIQKSLLPEIDSLKDLVPESFIFLQPKDKVSGDFYYFERFDDRVIVTVADATGHGVPGAFISLIGFVTIKELINRKEALNPAQLLTNLDFEVNKTLHQFNGQGEGKDGMDMAICDINMKTLKIKMASALRPIWIFRSGVFEKIRSSKSTVGGGMNGKGAPLKDFDLEERQLQKGDTIYLFSDGYVDQFGSELNKKLMSKRFLKLLTDNNHLPMEAQGQIVSKFLNDWKGDLDQTDDILVIGIRV